MANKKDRRKSRKTSLCILYSNDVVDIVVEDVLSGKASLPHIEDIDEYAEMLVRGTVEHIEEIDKKLHEVSENWALDRMPATDRCLLRQSVYEMLYVDEVPISVSINEAVELAKEFGGEDDSHKFVNGILGKIAKEIDEG